MNKVIKNDVVFFFLIISSGNTVILRIKPCKQKIKLEFWDERLNIIN